MIKASHNKWYELFFHRYINVILKRHFHEINFNPFNIEKHKSTLILANHISWWDGFFMLNVNLRYIHKKIHVMMLEEELSRRKFLSKIGAYSIKKKTRGVIESIKYTKELLEDPDNLVVVYPQGEITSLYQHDISFQKGIFSMFKNNDFTNNAVHYQLIMAATMIDFASNPKPTVMINLKEYDMSKSLNAEEIEKKYQAFYRNAILGQIHKIKALNPH